MSGDTGWRVGLAAACLVLGLGTNGARANEREVIETPRKPVPASYFGVHNIRFHNVKLRPSLDFGVWRLWDTGTNWGDLQPGVDKWTFERLDFALSLASQSGYNDLILTLGRTPAWASQRPTEKSFYGPGAAAPPRDLADFSRYVRTVAQRYRGRIQWYEIWNEPASGGMYTGTIEQMVQLTRAARQEVLAADPAARIICPSPAKRVSLEWYGQFLAAGGGNHCDVMGYHFYTDSRQPEERLRLIREVQALLAKHGQGAKPLWDTESGLNIGRTRELPPEVARDDAHLARWLILTWASGVERFYWYAWDHDTQGFVHPDGNVRSNAIQAYRQVQSWMKGSTFRQCTREGVLWECTLDRADGRSGRIVWTADNSTRMVGVGTGSRVEDLSGNGYKPRSATIPASGTPQWVTDG